MRKSCGGGGALWNSCESSDSTEESESDRDKKVMGGKEMMLPRSSCRALKSNSKKLDTQVGDDLLSKSIRSSGEGLCGLDTGGSFHKLEVEGLASRVSNAMGEGGAAMGEAIELCSGFIVVSAG